MLIFKKTDTYMKFGGESRKLFDSAFQIDELHRHNQNLVGTLHARSLLWSTDMKTAVNLNQENLTLPE